MKNYKFIKVQDKNICIENINNNLKVESRFYKDDSYSILYIIKNELGTDKNICIPKSILKYNVFKENPYFNSYFKKHEEISITGKLYSVLMITRNRISSINNMIKLLEKNELTGKVYTKYNNMKYHSSYLGANFVPDLKYIKILKTESDLEKNIIKYFKKDSRMASPIRRKLSMDDLFLFLDNYVLSPKKINFLIYDFYNFNNANRVIPIRCNNANKGMAQKILEKKDNEVNLTKDKKYLCFKFYDNYMIVETKDIENNLELLYKIAMDEDLQKIKKELNRVSNIRPEKDDKIVKLANKLILGRLYPLQEIGVSWLYKHYKNKSSGVLLADEMGLGKTIQTIAFLSVINKFNKFKSKGDILIICPAIIIDVWINEFKKFNPDLLKYIEIYSYQKWNSDLKSEKKIIKKRRILIIDETQKLKNKNTLSYNNINLIERDFTILLSGTPVENKAQDYQNILMLINPVFGRFFGTLNRILKKDENILIQKSVSVTKPYILSRKVPKNQLDVKIKYINYKIKPNPKFKEIELSKKIKKFYGNNLIRLKSKSNLEYYNAVITALIKLRQVTSLPKQLKNMPKNIQAIIPNEFNSSKLEALINLTKKFNEDDKSIIFTEFTETAKIISNKLNCPMIIGSTSKSERKKLIDEYQHQKYKNIVISLKAGNAGITLTEANKIIFFDLWWNPAILSQAIARAYRTGQVRDVNVFYMILENTIDEKIIEIMNRKKELIDNYNKKALLEDPNKIDTIDNSKVLESKDDLKELAKFIL